MINWMYFPQNKRIEKHLLEVVNVFQKNNNKIDSDKFCGDNSLVSNEVLNIISNDLQDLGYEVEKSKKDKDKISVPVLFEKNGQVSLKFEVDAFSADLYTVIEVEAGRAVTNYQFLKDFYEACMMQDVKYFCVAVRNTYKNKQDFEKVCDFFVSLFVSNRVKIPLEGILVIGY